MIKEIRKHGFQCDILSKREICMWISDLSRGGMAEWLKAAVLKTVVPKGTVGSNPTSSAINFISTMNSFNNACYSGALL